MDKSAFVHQLLIYFRQYADTIENKIVKLCKIIGKFCEHLLDILKQKNIFCARALARLFGRANGRCRYDTLNIIQIR